MYICLKFYYLLGHEKCFLRSLLIIERKKNIEIEFEAFELKENIFLNIIVSPLLTKITNYEKQQTIDGALLICGDSILNHISVPFSTHKPYINGCV